MRKGSFMTEEQKKRISEGRKGKNLGPRSEEVKRKISEATKGVKKTITKPNSSWFPKGFTPWIKGKKGFIPWNKGKLLGEGKASNKCKLWKKQVFERDGYMCVKCGSYNSLHAHHIISWKKNKELRFDLNNGMTLCNSCHSKVECVLGEEGKGHRYQKGHIHSNEAREKMSKSHLGKVTWNKGLVRSEEYCKKLSEALKGRKAWNKGKKFPGIVNSGSFKKGLIPWNKKEFKETIWGQIMHGITR